MTTIQPKDGVQAYLGNPMLFSGTPPIDLSETDSGYGGSQHQFLLKTEFGHIYIDAKRGQVLLMRGTQAEDLADKGMDKWFSKNLPFNILNINNDIPIDNTFLNLGILGVYDPFYKRLIITKLDYEAKKPGITYSDNKFKFAGQEINVLNSEYFYNRSWTLSYSFITQSWISFHSFADRKSVV